MLETIKQLRKELHQYPELSGQEAETASRVRKFVLPYQPTEIITRLGGHGLAVVFAFPEPGPVVMIRCELDALPIEEANDFQHRSLYTGVAHKCGHDGHMAIVAGLAVRISERKFQRGKVILLFQPAEETGEGAAAVLNDPRFKALAPDYVFALHNLPGEPLHSIITVKEAFSATVQSVAIYLTGVQSHASEPEKGINPAAAMARIVNELAALNKPDIYLKDFALLTPVHLLMGSKAYGISAGSGELHYTMRSWTEAAMQELKHKLNELVSSVCKAEGLQASMEWFDYFPASVNDAGCNSLIAEAAHAQGFDLKERPHPFKFGEDFGWFSKGHKAALFGVGAGLDSPALHHTDYDFPDDLIETGIRMFTGIIERILQAPSPGS